MAASMWNENVQNFLRGEDDKAVDCIAKEILDRKLKLVELVDGLEKQLTSPEVESRSKGTQLLSEVLKRLPHDFLNESEVSVLVAFMCDRLQDHHSIQPHALQALLALILCDKLPNSCVKKVVSSIFKEVQTQMLAQPVRRAVFTILDSLLSSPDQCTELQSMGGDLVFGYIQTMDGEKDPRNLLTAFHSVPIITKNFPIGTFAEDLFEVVACYFPIDFTPKDDEPQSIKTADLVEGLRHCLAASEKFAPFCLPLLLEKLNSDIETAKIDALYTLAQCASVYGCGALQEYVCSIWSAIRRLVFSNDADSEVTKAALTGLISIVNTLSQEVVQDGHSQLAEFIKESLIKDCQRYLTSPEQNLLTPSCLLLVTAASASKAACCLLLPLVVKVLLDQFEKQQQAHERKGILDGLVQFIQVANKLKFKAKSSQNPLVEFVDRLETLFTSLLVQSNSNLRIASLRGLGTLTGYFDDAKRPLLAENVTNIILRDKDAAVRQESLKFLVAMAEDVTQVIVQTVLPLLVAQLHTEPMEVERESVPNRGDILEAMATLSVHEDIYKITLSEFVTNLKKCGCSVDLSENCLSTARCLLKVVSQIIQDESGLRFSYTDVLLPLLEMYLGQNNYADAGDSQSPLLDISVVKTVSLLISKIIQHLDSSLSQDVVNLTVEKVIEKEEQNQNTCESKFSQKLQIFTAVACSTKHQITQLADVLSWLLDKAFDNENKNIVTMCAKCHAGLINKMATGSELDHFVESTCKRLGNVIDNIQCSISAREHALIWWTWHSKALVIRGHSSAKLGTTKILQLLSDTHVSRNAAASFHVILNDFDDIMTRDMHANIRLMYRQRFFQEMAPQVISSYQGANQEVKPSFLIALSHLLSHAPKQILTNQLSSMLPLLMESLMTESADLTLNTLHTLHSLVEQNAELIAPYADTLIPRLLTLSVYKPKMSVRRSALRTLGTMTTLPHHFLYPHVTTVTKSLATVLDDHKRLVRKDAAMVRSEWFLVGSA